jgi:hypothetical protein
LASAEFSEFSYGFALTHALVSALASVLPAAPIFPSLLQEGSSGGGHDLKLPLVPIPLFLQFKVPSVLTRSSSLRPPGFSLPYYRMPLRTKPPNQHQLLLDLEITEPLVYYAAPRFDTVNDLDSHFVASRVHTHSLFIKPSAIGTLSVGSHHLSYRAGSTATWIHSEPKRINGAFRFDALITELKQAKQALRKKLQLSDRRPSDSYAYERQRLTLDRLAQTFRNYVVDEKSRYWALTSDAEERGLRPHRKRKGRSPRGGDPSAPNSAALDLLREGEPGEMAKRLAYFAQVHLGLMIALTDAADAVA